MSSTIASSAIPATSDSVVPAIKLSPASTVFANLLRADLTTQWRNRRASIMVVLIPSIILITWKGLVEKFGAPFVLSNCITLGLNAVGLMGYTISIARDRERGIFQRLRITPAPRWTIMLSRLTVQLFMIVLVTIILFIVGYQVDNIHMQASGYALTFCTAVVGGAVYLSLGQTIVGLIRNAETVNVTTRLIFFLFIMTGMFASLGALGQIASDIAKWSPYGAVQRILADSLNPGAWKTQSNLALLTTIGYILLFSIIGIRKFQWQSSK